MKFQYRRIKHLAQVDGPQLVRNRPTDAGADIRASEHIIIKPRESAIVSTGICVDFFPGYMGMVRPRSGLAFKQDVVAFGGTADAYFTGHLQVKVFNHSMRPVEINVGDRIAQLVVVPIEVGEFVEVEELDTEKFIRENNEAKLRGDAGFGSSGMGD